ncbi:uncharacterized protein EDB91DRAFT_1121301 [Suillus paluster]|uniref:uncharacterized protein n=1 Tax=Suillus paluster TaxID=48578 RepID=UPI001B8606A5|nr:uncharacterized protein EDB91DRAFT_1121301 [Suillus paluster]KAG1745503.1 hypothetical protein EDB91DRAFT_1121301 [Suillus paluster]
MRRDDLTNLPVFLLVCLVALSYPEVCRACSLLRVLSNRSDSRQLYKHLVLSRDSAPWYSGVKRPPAVNVCGKIFERSWKTDL